MRTAEEAILVAALDGDEDEVRARCRELLRREAKALEAAMAMIEGAILDTWKERQAAREGE